MIVEVHGLELFGYHGVLPEEKATGQPFLYDVSLQVPDAAGASDRIEDAVDYREVIRVVREVSDARSFDLIEALAVAVAEAIAAAFPVERVRVTVRKRPQGLGVEYTAASVERP